MLLTHSQGIYRGDLKPDGHLYGFGKVYYKIESWCNDIHIGHWNKDKFHDYGIYIYSTADGSYYKGDWLTVNDDVSGRSNLNKSSGTIYYGNFSNNDFNGYGAFKTDKVEMLSELRMHLG